MILINENRLRQIIREAVAVAAGEEALKALGFEDLDKGLAIAKKKAAGKEMGFVRDVDDLYAYAAIGGNLTVGPTYAPEMFVVIHDGARPDKKSLGSVFMPNDPAPTADQFMPVELTGSEGIESATAAADALVAAYKGGNSYSFLVGNIRRGVLPAGDAAMVAATPPAAPPSTPPAAPASEPSAAEVVSSPAGKGDSKKPSWLSKWFKRKSERKQQPAGMSGSQPLARTSTKQVTSDTPPEPVLRAKAIAFRIWAQLTAGSGIQVSIGEGNPFFDTFAAKIKRAIMGVTSRDAKNWFSKSPKEVLPDSLVRTMSTSSVDKFLASKSINDSEIKNVYAMMVDAYNSSQASIEANKEYFDKLSRKRFQQLGRGK